MFRKICGETTLRNVIVVTNMWEDGSRDVSEARERELRDNFFKPAIDKGAQMARHNNTPQSAHDIIRTIIRSTKRYHPVALRIQYELVDKPRDIADTTAGKAINRELNEQTRRERVREIKKDGEAPGPQLTPHVVLYVQAVLHVATHEGLFPRITGARAGRTIQGQIFVTLAITN